MIRDLPKINKKNVAIVTLIIISIPTLLFISIPTLFISLIKNNEIPLYLGIIFIIFSLVCLCLLLVFSFNPEKRSRFKICIIIILLVINLIASYFFISKYSPPTPPGEQLLKEVKICYVRVDNLIKLKELGMYGGKEVRIIGNEIIDIAEKNTLPGSYIGFLVLEIEKKRGLSVTNLKIPRTSQIHSSYYSSKSGTKNQILNKKNSVFIKDEWEPLKSINSDDPQFTLIPFCITSKIRVNGEPTDREIPGLFNNAEHIILYYHISKIKYKTNGSNKWQSKLVKPMQNYSGQNYSE